MTIAHNRYLPVNKREELVASLMVDALAQASGGPAVAPRRSSTSWDRSMLTKADALREALAALEVRESAKRAAQPGISRPN